MKYKVTFIGSGNVATNLAHAFDKAGHTINQVISHNIENAKLLARKFGAYYGDTASEMYKDSDFVILCVNDEAYASVLESMPGGMHAIICHTAGPISMDVLAKYSDNYGVIYPLQSLRKEELTDLMEVPIFTEWSSEDVRRKVTQLADSISNRVKEVSSEERNKYHLAAVFANNFSNLMYTIADEYLEAEGLDFNNLLPIIKETALRLKSGKPSGWQTGPAKRGDRDVIAKHIAMLKEDNVRDVYEKLSDFLMNKAQT
ncbi:MAG: hypothetical protein COA58_09660 [Bacteroidetes bacterium]|nr:MAG: hypothetical protein COA58_09660 [Bacteroidota bacterium]